MTKKLFVAVTLGVFSIALIGYYYFHQRNYAQQYKTVVNGFNTLQNSYNKLSYKILKSALYGYSDQDDISSGMQKLNLDYANLYNAPLLHEEQYLPLDYPLIDLGMRVADYNSAIEHYLMLNAGIKNSFVFLLNYSETAHELFPNDAPVHKDINVIISELSSMRRLLDKDHLTTINEHLTHLRSFPTANDAQKEFIETIALHISYIQSNFPAFITIINTLQNKEVEISLNSLKEHFNQIAQTDFVLIDTLAFLLLLLIISAMVVIILLLTRSQNENRRLKRLKKELEYAANFDILTGLLNRNSLNRTLQQQQYKRPTFLLININGFKHVNDLYGAQMGDYILQEVSQLIKLPIFATYDPSYYRLGGDDFGILLEDISNKKALSFAEALTQSIKHFIFVDNEIEINITISIAINSIAPLLENADMVLKHYKKKKAETIVQFTPELNLKAHIQNNINVLQSLSLAISEDRIVPCFQPIIDLDTGKIVKYEALVRQLEPDGTLLSPYVFLELATQTPLYRELTQIMIEKVFATFSDQPYRFSINLSMQDLLDKELMTMLEAHLIANPESAKRLEIELLESENLFDIQATEHFITLLKSYGCSIAIDDFGTGYSNFFYLAKLSIDTLKIDGSLISKIISDEKYFKTVEAIVHYAQTLGVETVAEFVETKEIAEKLKEMGVTYGQGYYFGRPQRHILPSDRIT